MQKIVSLTGVMNRVMIFGVLSRLLLRAVCPLAMGMGLIGVAAAPAAAGDPPLVNPHRVTIHGDRVAGGCAYLTQLYLAPGEKEIAQNEISRDDQTCTMVAERGVPASASSSDEDSFKSVSAVPEDNRSPSGQNNRSSPGGGTPSRGASTTSPFAISSPTRRSVLPPDGGGCAGTRSAGNYKSWWEDPLTIDVNSVKNTVDFKYGCGVVLSGSCIADYGWLTASGWSLKSDDLNCYYNSTYKKLTSGSAAHYHNGIFCATIDTDAYYDRNNVQGDQYGGLWGWTYTWVSGGCTSLLKEYENLKRTV